MYINEEGIDKENKQQLLARYYKMKDKVHHYEGLYDSYRGMTIGYESMTTKLMILCGFLVAILILLMVLR